MEFPSLDLCSDRRGVTAPTALILAHVFGNNPDFWLNWRLREELDAMFAHIDRMGPDRFDLY